MKKNSSVLFAISAAIPLLLVLFAYLKSAWGWTLINDYGFLTMGTNFGERLNGLWVQFMQLGQLKWTLLLRYAFTYTAFAHAPKLFFIYQWGEILLMFFVWGSLAYRLTGKRIAIVLMPAVVLTSRCFYDAFFFPTLGDNFAMLIFGAGLLTLVHAESLVMLPVTSVSKNWQWPLALVLLILALGSMEFTLAGIMALGFALCWLYKARHGQGHQIFTMGIVLVMAALLYGIFLKTIIVHGYSSAYRLTDLHKILINLLAWGKEVFSKQAPWLVAVGVTLFKTGGVSSWSRYSLSERFGIVLGVLMYGLWLAVLLPWSAVGYHAVPLIIVFAFAVAVLLATPLSELKESWGFGIAIIALLLNLNVAQQEIYTHRLYNAEVQRLLYFIENNSDFQQAANEGKVYCNQEEPAAFLPLWANSQAGLNLKAFNFDVDVNNVQQKGASYFIFLTWGYPLGTLLNKPGWEPVSVGEFCKVYKK